MTQLAQPDPELSAFVKATGLVLDEITSTKVTGRLIVNEDHHTPWGIVHGGVYTSAIETAASAGASRAVQDSGQFAVGLTNTTNFLRSLTHGELAVVATTIHQGRTHQLWRVDITDSQHRMIAHGEVRLQNITPRGEPHA